MWSNLQSSFTAKINMSCYRISTLLCLTALLALWPHVTEAQLKLTNFNMTRAVEILAERFRQVATDGLGIDALKDNYQQASYSYSDLNGSYIQQLLSNSSFPETINQVLTLFDDVVSDSTSGGSVDPVECCSASAGSAEVCCYSCSSPASSTISTIAGAYANSDLIDSSTLLFASPSGALLTQPPSADCDGAVKDGRLQTWFTNATRENPVEMVVVLDVFRRPVFITNDSLYGELVNGVTTVLRSLNNKDRIALVGVDVNSPRIPRASIFSATETTPICPEAVLELEAFMTSFSPSGMADYNAAFEKAFSFFSNDLDTDKLLLFFTSGLGGSGENSLLANITRLKNSRNNSVSLSVFRIVNDGVSNFESITSPDGFVVDLSDDHVTLRAPLSSLVAGYYQLNQSALTPSDDVFYSHAINRAGGALSLTRPYFNGSSLVGVFRALLPWQQLLGHIFSALMDRPSSYPFVTDRYGRVLYHPLIPSDGDENVHIADLETETNDIMGVLESLGSATIQMHPVVKQLLRHTGSEDENAFFPHNTTSDYYCHQFALNNGDILYLCIVLAEVDMSVASLNSINPSVVYEDGVTAPLYHNLQLSASEEQTCNYFCKRSLNDRVSFQLTGPGVPADSASFVDEVTEFVTGDRSTAPGGVDPLVATEIALASRSVASTWTNTSSAPSGYITRRHLATSSGVYLSYPAVQINKNFIPSLTEWYQASVARGNLLTLTPPRMDSLNEAGQFAISAAYTVRARRQSQQSPNPTGITRPLAVVAADLTLSSVRSFIREAVPGCEEDGSASCLIIDDMINLIYDRDTYSRSGLGSSPRFLGKPLIDEQFFQYQGVLFDLIRRVSSDLLTKMQCVDYYSTDIETRRFYRLDTSVIKLFMNVSHFCVDYLLQHIPDTNSFLLIVKQKSRSCRGQIVCGCSTGNKCTNCNDFSTEFCECPCVCSDNCRRDPGRRVLACPAINTMDNFVAAESASLTDSSALLDPPFCFNQGCNCRGQDSCLSSRECSWCEAERRCVHVSDCCSRDESGACCGQSPQLDRFRGYGSCITDVCLSEPGAFDVTCPTFASSGQTSLIVAVVVGCTFGLILIVFLVIFIIWYQFFRKLDVAEETSRESAFDFSKKRMETVNPMANSAPDVKSDNGNDVGNATKSTSPHPPSEKPEKTDLSEKSNGKDETFL